MLFGIAQLLVVTHFPDAIQDYKKSERNQCQLWNPPWFYCGQHLLSAETSLVESGVWQERQYNYEDAYEDFHHFKASALLKHTR